MRKSGLNQWVFVALVIEPTRATDWQPVETKQPEPEVKPSEPEPEPAVFQAETPAPPPHLTRI